MKQMFERILKSAAGTAILMVAVMVVDLWITAYIVHLMPGHLSDLWYSMPFILTMMWIGASVIIWIGSLSLDEIRKE